MDAQEFKTKAITVLRGHTNELESMQTAIKRVVDAKQPAIPNQKDIFKAIGDTAEECRQTIEYYDEKDPMPEEVQIAVCMLSSSFVWPRSTVMALVLNS